MTAARRRIDIQPYNLTWGQVAESVFQRSESWLRAHIDEFVEKKGFPRPDSRFDAYLFNRHAVEAWVNGPYGRSASSLPNMEQAMLEEAARGA